MTPLPYGRIFWNDVLGECDAKGFTLQEQGIVFRLLRAQHMNGGTIPADLPALQRLVGGDAKLPELRRALAAFFPFCGNGQRQNAQHAAAHAAALRAYDAAVERGRRGAAGRWGQDDSSNG